MQSTPRFMTTLVFALAAATIALAVFSESGYAGESVTVSRVAVTESYFGNGYNFTRYKTDDGADIYDYDVGHGSQTSGTVMTLTDDWDATTQVVLENMPHTGAGERDWYIAQSAIWLAKNSGELHEDFLEGEEAYPGMRNELTELRNLAYSISARNYSGASDYFEDRALSCTPSDEDVHLVNVNGKAYYETALIAVIAPYSTFYRVIPTDDDVRVVSEEGTEVWDGELEKAKGFRLRLPMSAVAESGSIAFEITSSATIRKMEVYENPAAPDLARMAMLGDEKPYSASKHVELADSWLSGKRADDVPFVALAAVSLTVAGILVAASRLFGRKAR